MHTAVDHWDKHYRIIPSCYPPINFFEKFIEPDEWEIAAEIESLTNDRLNLETGNIDLIHPEDRITGPGTSVINASFTHIGHVGRFNTAEFGVYYCSNTIDVAIAETKFHQANFARYNRPKKDAFDMRSYVGDSILQSLLDVRENPHLHHPSDYSKSQVFSQEARRQNEYGLLYQSVRHSGGECIAALRPTAISVPRQHKHFRYIWENDAISVFELKSIMS